MIGICPGHLQNPIQSPGYSPPPRLPSLTAIYTLAALSVSGFLIPLLVLFPLHRMLFLTCLKQKAPCRDCHFNVTFAETFHKTGSWLLLRACWLFLPSRTPISALETQSRRHCVFLLSVLLALLRCLGYSKGSLNTMRYGDT